MGAGERMVDLAGVDRLQVLEDHPRRLLGLEMLGVVVELLLLPVAEVVLVEWEAQQLITVVVMVVWGCLFP